MTRLFLFLAILFGVSCGQRRETPRGEHYNPDHAKIKDDLAAGVNYPTPITGKIGKRSWKWVQYEWEDGGLFDPPCVIEQESVVTPDWDPVVTVHGFGEKYQMAERIIEGLKTLPKPRRYRIRIMSVTSGKLTGKTDKRSWKWIRYEWEDGGLFDPPCVIEQESVVTPDWDPVVTVHGFGEKYQMAERIIEGLKTLPKPRRYRIRIMSVE